MSWKKKSYRNRSCLTATILDWTAVARLAEISYR